MISLLRVHPFRFSSKRFESMETLLALLMRRAEGKARPTMLPEKMTLTAPLTVMSWLQLDGIFWEKKSISKFLGCQNFFRTNLFCMTKVTLLFLKSVSYCHLGLKVRRIPNFRATMALSGILGRPRRWFSVKSQVI